MSSILEQKAEKRRQAGAVFDLPEQWEHLREWLIMAPWEIERLGTTSFINSDPRQIPEIIPTLLSYSVDGNLTKEQRAVARVLAGEGMLRGRFTTAQVCELAPRFLTILNTKAHIESNKMGRTYLMAGFAGLLGSPMKTSVAGTLTRMLWLYGEYQPQGTSRLLGITLLSSPTVPVEVLARVAQHYPVEEVQLTDTSVREFEASKDRLLPRMRAAYPEFAALPGELLTQLVASQPVPTAWFKDAWVLPTAVTHRTDGREIGGDFWGDFLPLTAPSKGTP